MARSPSEDFIDQKAAAPLRLERDAAIGRAEAAQPPLDQAELHLQATSQAYLSGRETFANWVATRTATERPAQDVELIARTARLDALKAAEDKARTDAEAQRQIMLDARQAQARADARMEPYSQAARNRYEAELRKSELRVFGYRLALTLPLLAIAGWLFARKRQSKWWPFVWGFIIFALFAFFVELGALSTQLWRLCALWRRHHRHGAGWPLCHHRAEQISRRTATCRSAAQPGAAARR